MPSERNLTDNDIELLSAYLDGELSAEERATLETRLESDAILRAELRTLRKTVELVKVLPQAKAPRNFTLTQAMVRARQPRVLMFPATGWVSALSAAAAFVLVLAGVALLTLRQPSLTVDSSLARDTQQAVAQLSTATHDVNLTVTAALENTITDLAAPSVVAQPTQGLGVDDRRNGDEDAESADVLTDIFSMEQSQIEEVEIAAEAPDDGAAEAAPTALIAPFAQSDVEEEFDREDVPFAAQIPQDGQIPTGRGGAGGQSGGGGGMDATGGFGDAIPAPDAASGAIGQSEDALDMAQPSAGMVAPQQGEASIAATVVETVVSDAARAAVEEQAGADAVMQQEAPAEAPMMEMAQVATGTPTDEPTQTPTTAPSATPVPTDTPASTPTVTPVPAALALPEGTAGIVGLALIVLGIMAFGLFAMTQVARRRGG